MLGILIACGLLYFSAQELKKPQYICISPLEIINWEGVPEEESEAIDKILKFREKYPKHNDLTNLELSEKMAKEYPEWQKVYEIVQRIAKKAQEKGYEYNYAQSKPSSKMTRSKTADVLDNLNFVLLLFGYPFYLLIRFIIWAIRTLVEK